ncbi:hypothetical protein Salat_2695000 [Sesamum alatum]|uniref:Uncharacterized protein n=1 Tax=Sesamum alatum TaxID=300844 RepID=A0AAE1XQW9_9LAMI|nr:hypothetical protein Salat_2695000 [Sesamum alatum]
MLDHVYCTDFWCEKEFLMGCTRDWLVVCIIFNAWLWQLVQGSERDYSRDLLDSFVYDNVFQKLPRPRTGKLYNVALPANFSGMEVSVVRLRARRLWKNGSNYSPSFAIPRWVLPWPFTRRVDLVYQNLGNLSSSYYDVPNHTLVAPVIGFLAYDPNRSSPNYGLIELTLMGRDPIIVRFPNILTQEDGNVTMKCVRFDINGSLEFSNVMKSSCLVRRQGHFSVVVPYQSNRATRKKYWMMGIAAGVVGLVLLVVIGVLAYRWIKGERIKKMERNSERSEGLDTIWVGRSRMPTASGIRTQPAIENSYLP